MSANSQPIRLVLLGPPASGKGTQGRAIAGTLGLAYLSTGALLREEVENRTDLGMKAEPVLGRGEYLPDEWMCEIVSGWLQKAEGAWVLDGFPRSAPQASFLARWLESRGETMCAAVFLDVPFGKLLGRIRGRVECSACRWTGQRDELVGADLCPECGGSAAPRDDDREENFRSRYRQFERLTLPAADFYRRSGLLISVDATRPKNVLTRDIVDLIEERRV